VSGDGLQEGGSSSLADGSFYALGEFKVGEARAPLIVGLQLSSYKGGGQQSHPRGKKGKNEGDLKHD